MRVLHVYSGNLYGGVETLLATLARGRRLCPEMEPHFALCFEGRLSGELRSTGAPVHMLGRVRLSAPHMVLRARARLKALLRRESFGAVVCHAPWSLIVGGGVVRSAGVPLVFWMHDAACGRHWIERWARRTRPDLVICNSRFTETTASALFPGTPSEVLYCPVEQSGGRALAPTERVSLRASLGASDGDIVIVQASRMEEWKGHSLLLRALGRLKDVPGWTCWIAGGAQRPSEVGYVKTLEEEAARLGITARVHFLGQREDVPELLAAADIYCQPNAGPEPFGIALIEALAVGLPVVTTSIGAAPEIIDDSCGVLVPTGDATSLAEALRGLIDSPKTRAELGAGGAPRAERLCDVQRRTSELYALLSGAVRSMDVDGRVSFARL
jgi:glycosyltransferase involved in cell wall biosynthesis